MKKLIISMLLVALALPGGEVLAAYNTFTTDAAVTVYMSNPNINLIINSGANVESLTVNAADISITLAASSLITIESSDRVTLVATNAESTTTATFTCPSTGNSTMAITATGGDTMTVTPSGNADCTTARSSGSSGTGGGGGGGGGVTTVAATAPTNTSIQVSANAAETTSQSVSLTLSATGASQMMISNLSSFASASWETYATSKTWTLASGLGKKTVYVKFKSSGGLESSAVSDNIMLLPAVAAESITKSKGGKVGLSDNIVSVDIPAGALSSDALVSITAKSSYTSPTTKKLAGLVYDLKAESGSTNLTKFSKDLTLTFTYSAEDVKSLDEGTLALYYWDSSKSDWAKVGGTVDKTKKTVAAKVDHFTLFALLGDESYKSGDLVKLKCDSSNKDVCTAVYYIGNNGKRYVFPNSKVYNTWYDDFSSVKTISASQLAAYAIGGNVNYRPGVKMVKIDTDPKTYAVAKNGELKWVKTEAMAKSLYGDNWNKQIDDIPDAFFFNYTTGNAVSLATDYVVATVKASATTINMDKGL